MGLNGGWNHKCVFTLLHTQIWGEQRSLARHSAQPNLRQKWQFAPGAEKAVLRAKRPLSLYLTYGAGSTQMFEITGYLIGKVDVRLNYIQR